MIERVNQTIEMSSGLFGFNVRREFNFPRASLLEYQYRLQPLNGGEHTSEYTAGITLLLGNGNPPDWGLGNQQSEFLPLPPQLVGLKRFEEERSALKAAIAAVKAQATRVQSAAELAGKTSELEGQILSAQAEGLRAEQAAKEAELARLESAKPTLWSPSVSGSFPRAFDALRIRIELPEIVPEKVYPWFLLEHTFVVSRPEDQGAQPTINAGGR
jgi:hypothetical protein